MTLLTVFSTGIALPQLPRVTVEVSPCGNFKWYVEVHVSFYYEKHSELTDWLQEIPKVAARFNDQKEYPDYHYQDLDKHFWRLRSAIRYGQDMGDKLSWFFHKEFKQNPDLTPSYFAEITDLKERLL